MEVNFLQLMVVSPVLYEPFFVNDEIRGKSFFLSKGKSPFKRCSLDFAVETEIREKKYPASCQCFLHLYLTVCDWVERELSGRQFFLDS